MYTCTQKYRVKLCEIQQYSTYEQPHTDVEEDQVHPVTQSHLRRR